MTYVLILAAALYVGFQLWTACTHGTIDARYIGNVSRTKKPVLFWVAVGWCVVVLAVAIVVLAHALTGGLPLE